MRCLKSVTLEYCVFMISRTGSARVSHSRKCGMRVSFGNSFSKAFIAPHCEWPQMTISLTRNHSTANSMAAAVELLMPLSVEGGTILQTVFTTNKSPGWLWVISSANTRESEQVMKSVCG